MKYSKANQIKKMSGLTMVAVFFLALNVMSGCASHSKTVHTETVSNPSSQTVVVEKETTNTTSEKKDYGILGGAFHVVGEVIAFPFEVIAGLFRFIF